MAALIDAKLKSLVRDGHDEVSIIPPGIMPSSSREVF
jgi:hypothetical protein